MSLTKTNTLYRAIKYSSKNEISQKLGKVGKICNKKFALQILTYFDYTDK